MYVPSSLDPALYVESRSLDRVIECSNTECNEEHPVKDMLCVFANTNRSEKVRPWFFCSARCVLEAYTDGFHA